MTYGRLCTYLKNILLYLKSNKFENTFIVLLDGLDVGFVETSLLCGRKTGEI